MMAESKQLGMFWGNQALYFVETEGAVAKKVFHIPIEKKDAANLTKDAADPQKSKLVVTIKSTLSKYKVSGCPVNLSLPTRDIIFRTFIIPFMQPHEIKSVVEFEISKYIPFPLDELSFAFHPLTIKLQEGGRAIRIIFAAIKNDALETYASILEAVSLNVTVAEPAALSLIRALNSKSHIPKDETIALIEQEDVGRITIADNETPQFVREFHLSAMSHENVAQDLDNDIKKLGKEARISLDYFNRQNAQLLVKKIYLLTLSQPQELSSHIESFLNIPTTAIDIQDIITEAPKIGLGILNAYGASIFTSKSAAISFNLMRKKPKKILPAEAPVKRPINIKSVIVTVLVCAPVIAASFLFSKYTLQKYSQNISDLKAKLGVYQDTDSASIQQLDKNLQDKLDYFKDTRTKSNITLFLALIPELLPEGTWIDTLNVKYDDSKFMNSIKAGEAGVAQNSPGSTSEDLRPTLTLTIDGYAFSLDKNLQFRLVNVFLGTLKKNNDFARFFENIDLQTTQIEKLKDQDVTFFKIVCLHKYGLTGSQ